MESIEVSPDATWQLFPVPLVAVNSSLNRIEDKRNMIKATSIKALQSGLRLFLSVHVDNTDLAD